MSYDANVALDLLKKELFNRLNLEQAEMLFNKYALVLRGDYLEDYTSSEIVADIEKFETLSDANQYAIDVFKDSDASSHLWRIKLLKLDDQVSLSRGLPIIENFGVKLIDEYPYKLTLTNGVTIHVCDFGVEVSEQLLSRLNDKEIIDALKKSIIAVFNRQVENDSLNKLVLFSGLKVREVALLRAVTHYLVQTSLPFSRQYMAECLRSYPVIAQKLYKFFDAKFNIQTHDLVVATKIHAEIKLELEKVSSLDDDRILKAYVAVIDAMLRTNYYQHDANHNHKAYISFKVESAKLHFLPKPHPLYEVFVYSLRFEAIHLRGGKVARGGLRWSDRREDFRTEVLGLVKAQMVKNSVIVPTGSKGGFVCKKLPHITDRDAYMAEGISCYKGFISGLLDITDNLVAGKIIAPNNVVRYDGDDPYLVVAADKGTATFSDYANELSLKYGFWLGDAFASGGSVGYDHKKMAITSRGVWESVKRHFRHLGINTQEEDFTVVAIGDMAGDVFGNGMLLSKHIRLLAAFNHQHIFLDPNPDAASTFVERERLFNLPRSSWEDYDKSKISLGGGIYERSLKTIPLSKPVQEWLGISDESLTPNELIHLLLKSKADMLFNGGIGTYVKSESESHEVVKDKANDMLRVNGSQLKVRVLAEGGNLGVTQLGRIEFAKCGGLICTDAIDNSAGVDCSDHEVNIKILFADIMSKSGMPIETRNKILESMTDEVARLVLQDNYHQTEVLSYAAARSAELFAININFMEKMEKRGELDRKIEFLPNTADIIDRQRMGVGLTMPELSVLLAYSKMTLDRDLLGSDVIANPHFEELLINYFPENLQRDYLDYIKGHYLRREIISNQLANLIVNRMGITFISRFVDESGLTPAQIAVGFWTVYKLMDGARVFKEIESLDNKVPANIQVDMFIRFKKSLERMMRLVLLSGCAMDVAIGYKDSMTKLLSYLPRLIKTSQFADVAHNEESLLNAGVPLSLAQMMSRSGDIPQLFNIIRVSEESGHDLAGVAEHYLGIGFMLRFDWLRKNILALPENNKWQALSRSALLNDGFAIYSRLIRRALNVVGKNDANFMQTWQQNDAVLIKKLQELFEELHSYKVVDLAMLSAVVRELSQIID